MVHDAGHVSRAQQQLELGLDPARVVGHAGPGDTVRVSHPVVEGGSRRARRLLAELGQHERLAQALRARVHVRVDPAAREAQRGFLAAAARGCCARRQPRVGPEVDGGEVDVGRQVVAHEVAAQRQAVEGIVRQVLWVQEKAPGLVILY